MLLLYGLIFFCTAMDLRAMCDVAGSNYPQYNLCDRCALFDQSIIQSADSSDCSEDFLYSDAECGSDEIVEYEYPCACRGCSPTNSEASEFEDQELAEGASDTIKPELKEDASRGFRLEDQFFTHKIVYSGFFISVAAAYLYTYYCG